VNHRSQPLLVPLPSVLALSLSLSISLRFFVSVFLFLYSFSNVSEKRDTSIFTVGGHVKRPGRSKQQAELWIPASLHGAQSSYQVELFSGLGILKHRRSWHFVTLHEVPDAISHYIQILKEKFTILKSVGSKTILMQHRWRCLS
jgi:hypothetical protein